MDTARHLREHLLALGIEGASADLLVRFSAPDRHQHRVGSVLALGAPLDVIGWVLLDAIGVGGRLGLEGAATLRHPALAGLAARKQSGPGPAWTASLHDASRAAWALCGGRGLSLSGVEREGAELAVELAAGEDATTLWATSDVTEPQDAPDAFGRARSPLALPWVRALSGVALVRLAGVAPEFRRDVFDDGPVPVRLAGDVAVWSRLCNLQSPTL